MKHCTPKPRSLQANTDISELFAPIPKTFDDHHAEWWELRTKEQSALGYGRYAIARRRTEILESFPRFELPAALDRLNRPLETVYDIFGEN